MVALTEVRASNSKASTAYPPGLVAVFAGTTSGIGELALKGFAKHAPQPRIYFVGRSEEAGTRIKGELKTLNPQGEYVFIKAELSLMKSTDEVCAEIKSKEKVVNVLFMSQGTLRMTGKHSLQGIDALGMLDTNKKQQIQPRASHTRSPYPTIPASAWPPTSSP